MIDVRCPRDGTVHHADEIHIGKMLRCSHCGDAIPILDPRRPLQSSQAPLEPNHNPVSPIPKGELTPKKRWKDWLWVTVSCTLIILAGTVGTYIYMRNKRPAEKSRDVPIDLSAGMVDATTGQPRAPAQPGIQAATQPNSLPTGTRLSKDLALGGHGTLKITNGTFLDAVVTLASWGTDHLVRSVYIQAGSEYTLRDIKPGSYRMRFEQGSDWDDQRGRFRSDLSCFKFGKVLDFRETRDNDSIHYEDLSLTLNAVIGGNVQRVEIAPDEFNQILAQRHQF